MARVARFAFACSASLALAVMTAAPRLAEAQTPADTAPRILYGISARAVEYQLSRLTNERLVLVERRADDVRFRPVYVALLTRQGLARGYREEAIAAIAKMDGTSPTAVLLDGLARVPPDDTLTAGQMIDLVVAQGAGALREQRPMFASAIDREPAASPHVRRAAYAVLLLIDADPLAIWNSAGNDVRRLPLLESLAHLPAGQAGDRLRAQLAGPVEGLLTSSATSPDARAAALVALARIRPDAGTFTAAAGELRQPTAPTMTAAALRALAVIPEPAWPSAALEATARDIVRYVGSLPVPERQRPTAVDALQLGDRLASRLPEATRRAVRRDLRAAGVQVVRLETIPEAMAYDRRWFVVEAGRPMQIVFVNPDAMPHNVVVGAPGSVEIIGTTGGAMPMPIDPEVKPFVPNLPQVIAASRLIGQGVTDRVSFTAPRAPGEYIYVCTFPGHWVRMYGVMLVVADLDAWEASPTTPKDPMTGQPLGR